ncbi:hypothetical protein Lepto7375DRAFT_1809 [Leptolyngbya sp. PCC 7375]|nr:hypothetical protein Lepto7375DRAFT_1761 [Leptolyngbya sp. PCC 7375]EKU99741.1 hypothetical protein Lepto7375DRAFT_1809 [Leptolyngbya sp. PCC 7375]
MMHIAQDKGVFVEFSLLTLGQCQPRVPFKGETEMRDLTHPQHQPSC